MKINNINLFKNNIAIKQNKANFNPNYKTNPISNDSVSFSGKIANRQQVAELKAQVSAQKKLIAEISQRANNAANHSDEVLATSKDAFMLSLKDIEAIKKMPHTTLLRNPKGNLISYSFVMDENNEVSLEYSEQTPNGKLLRLVTAKDFIPTRISEFDRGRANVYAYDGDTVVATEKINVMNKPIGFCEGIYSYKNGKIQRISLVGNSASKPSKFNEVYFYQSNGKPQIASIGVTADENSTTSLREVTFDKYGMPVVLFENLYDDGSLGSKWDRSYHFYSLNSIARLEKCEQPAGCDTIYYESAIFPNNSGTYEIKKDSLCTVDVFGDLRFGN